MSESEALLDRYLIVKKVGSGSFGEVYIANSHNGEVVAAKVEEKIRRPRILYEWKVYKKMIERGVKYGIPRIYNYIETPDYNILVMQLLGPNLDELYNMHDRKFKMSTILYIGEVIITLLQNIHNVGYIHRDIKPNNFMIGNKGDESTLYIMDFGLSKEYIKSGKHIEYTDDRSLIGTARYASVNMHHGIEPSRRDDLESVGYMLLYFAKGNLPWQGISKKGGVRNKNYIEQIGKMKKDIDLNVLCEGLPKCFIDYLVYCRSLSFTDEPNYEYLRQIFRSYNTNPSGFEWSTEP